MHAGSAKERAYAFIKGEIIAGRFASGEFVSEGQIADALGVSRTPVREALQLLERAGFVRVFPKKGAYIPPDDQREMRQVWEARQLIETHCIALVSEKGDEGLAATLESLLEEQRRNADNGDIQAFMENDRDFHRAIVEAAGNSVLAQFYETLRDRQLRMGAQALKSGTQRFVEVLEEHEQIVLAVRAADSAKSCDAVREHMDRTRRAMER